MDTTANPIPGPVVRRAICDIRLLVAQKELSVGDRLPSERALAETLFVSRATIRASLNLMREQGEIETFPGRGGTVIIKDIASRAQVSRIDIATKSAGLIDRPSGSASGLPIMLASQGLECETTVLQADVRECPENICLGFNLPIGNRLMRIERIRTIGGEPISYEQTYINQRDYPLFLELDLTGSIYQLLRTVCSVDIRTVEESIEVVPGMGRCIRHLKLQTGVPLLCVFSRALDSSGCPVVLSQDTYPANKVRLTTSKTL